MKISKKQEKKFHKYYLYIRKLFKEERLEYDHNLYIGTLADSDDVIMFRGDMIPTGDYDIQMWNLKHWVNGELETSILTSKRILGLK